MRHLLFAALLCLAFDLLPAQGHQSVLPDLSGQPLIDALATQYKPATVLESARARDTLFARVDGRNDSLYCVYTGYGIYLNPNQDPTQAAFALGINTEHTWPQAYGAETGNAQSDMHHLFPTREDVNAARANLAFGELPDNQTQRWYRLAVQLTGMPSSFINEYSEWRNNTPFEPREDHKGNVARAMFYFYTMYRAQADAVNAAYFEPQRATLCQWHEADPVDAREWARTWKVASYQDGKPNPFILDCTLAARTYCPELAGANCITALDEPVAPVGAAIRLGPNPARFEVVVDWSATGWAGPVALRWVDAGGRQAGQTQHVPSGQKQTTLPTPGPGFWWCLVSHGALPAVSLPVIVIP